MSPFEGDCQPTRVPLLFKSGRPTLPFPHPWNFQRPIDILDAYFWQADEEIGPGRHNRYLDVPGFPAVLVTRDPGIIRAVLTSTGDREGQFDRDTLPSTGIARATGEDTLLFGNGAMWRKQRKASAAPFGKTALFQVDVFFKFEETFRKTVRQRLLVLRQHLLDTGSPRLQIAVEPEIKALMLELLVDCFFGASIDYQEIRDKYVPALERVIDHIVRDTVTNRLGLPRTVLAKISRSYAQANRDFATFDELTDRVLAARPTGRGLWEKLQTEASDEALRSNIKVFLAGALEATTSFATWAISHLARNEAWQEKVYREVEAMADYSPDQIAAARHLGAVLDETLRLTPSLYFLPRKATAPIRITTSDGREMLIPKNTHILLDVWHANRHEDHWGAATTGFTATEFAPERWEHLSAEKGPSKEHLHFGFGHGPRVCPGKHIGQLEVALVVGVFIKMFRFRALHDENPVKAGVSTKPADGTLVELELREPSSGMTTADEWEMLLKNPSDK
ncbi:cytochrome P450 [Bythopirellula goksoeyrii]|uniref:Putative bifunctional P-450/NADPH-P450 reductase 2 n=1 Tax=Bythopirellula goksoeyrii TaxID=1400387 RepID=A0A5B9Q7N2_9BACT|nr:cytochrome P450 [Bythopirellula goksoeyrii]QEG34988.1 putative bifunctional P-450/NADPH-P450 reductase 2 [Bythopirellula goksoeyrii]